MRYVKMLVFAYRTNPHRVIEKLQLVIKYEFITQANWKMVKLSIPACKKAVNLLNLHLVKEW